MESFPFTFTDTEVKLFDIINQTVTLVSPGGYFLPPTYKKVLPSIYNMEVRKDDIWLLGGPKQGNTWASELIWTVFHNADTDTATKVKHQDRWCFPELSEIEEMVTKMKGLPPPEPELYRYELTVNCKSPRLIRTHLAFTSLPPTLLDTAKVVYIARNLKDAAVSMYHMMKNTMPFPVSFDAYLEHSLEPQSVSTLGAKILKEAWERRHHPNMYFLFYEDMKKDLAGSIRKMASFLDRSLSEEQVKKLENHLSFSTMKKNPMINMEEIKEKGILQEDAQFVRKGIVGDWKNYFTPELEKKWNEWWKGFNCDVVFPEM